MVRNKKGMILAVVTGVVFSMAVPAVYAAPLAYQTAVLANNPSAYYRLGETSGTVAADSSGNSHAGTYVNNPILGVPGAGVASDTAASFHVSYVVTNDNLGSFGSQLNNFSVEMVLKTTTTNFGCLIGDSNGTSPNTGFVIFTNANVAGPTTGPTYFALTDDSGNYIDANITTSIYDGTYHDLVFTYDSGGASLADRLKAYVDGVSQAVSFSGNTNNDPSTFSNFTQPLALAALDQGGKGIGGESSVTLDEVSMYSQTLSRTQVIAHAEALTAVPEPGTAALLGLGGLGLLASRRKGKLKR
jgi:hypothetical protein